MEAVHPPAGAGELGLIGIDDGQSITHAWGVPLAGSVRDRPKKLPQNSAGQRQAELRQWASTNTYTAEEPRHAKRGVRPCASSKSPSCEQNRWAKPHPSGVGPAEPSAGHGRRLFQMGTPKTIAVA